MTNDATWEERLRRIEDIEEIRRLKTEYCNATDEGHDADRMVAIYTPDGVWESDVIGRVEGRDAIHAMFAGFQGSHGQGQHNTMNGDIRIDGDVAHATWHFLGLISRDGRTRLVATIYEDVFQRRDGRWLIHSVKATRKGHGDLVGFSWDDEG